MGCRPDRTIKGSIRDTVPLTRGIERREKERERARDKMSKTKPGSLNMQRGTKCVVDIWHDMTWHGHSTAQSMVKKGVQDKKERSMLCYDTKAFASHGITRH